MRHIASRLRAVCAIAGLISVALLASGGPASAALPPVTCLVGLCPKPGADAPQVPSEGLVHLFAPDGVWNKPLANDARLAPDSAGLVHALAVAGPRGPGDVLVDQRAPQVVAPGLQGLADSV